MKPRKPSSQEPQGDLYRTELVHLIDPEHALAKLAGVVDWSRLDQAFSPLYSEGRATADPDSCNGGSAALALFDGNKDQGENFKSLWPSVGRSRLRFCPLVADRTRKQRFFQEAKAASALNHPNNLIILRLGASGSSRTECS